MEFPIEAIYRINLDDDKAEEIQEV
jgi:hypothetical protein